MKNGPIDPRRALSSLGHRSRFSLVERLSRGGCCVTDLAREVALSQSCTTRHLQVLERAGIVAGSRRGKRVIYELRRDAAGLGGLLGWALGVEPEPPTGAGRPRRSSPRITPSARVTAGPSATVAPSGPPSIPAEPELEAVPTSPAPPEVTPDPRRNGAEELEDWLL